MKRIICYIAILLFTFSFIYPTKTFAKAPDKPYTTVDMVQQMISDALIPINEAITGLANRIQVLEDIVTQLGSRLGIVETNLATNSQNDTILNGRVDGFESRVDTLEAKPVPKTLKIFDNNGTELGIYMDPSKFFYELIGRRISVDLGDGHLDGTIDEYHTSSDCSGNAYITVSGQGDLNDKENSLLRTGPGSYFIIQRGTASETLNINSVRRYGGSGPSYRCDPYGSSVEHLYSLTSVSISFTEPVSIPLQYKYE